MAESVRITIPASVAVFVKPDAPLQERLRGAAGDVSLPPHELLLLWFCLSKDSEPDVALLAKSSLASVDCQLVLGALAVSRYHPALLHTLALLRGTEPDIRDALLARPELAEITRSQLAAITVTAETSGVADLDEDSEEALQDLTPAVDQDAAEATDDDAADLENDEYLSKYKLAQVMGIGEKIKMALTGDKEWRKILIKDANKLVSSGVLKNPRITEPEVLTVLKSGVQNDEVMRLICANKEWIKNYQIRKALIENPKTPLANALRYLGTMNEKELANYAKSKNISSVVATQAKRMLLNKKR